MALGHTNQKQNACVAFAELDHAFPNASPAVRKAAGEEKASRRGGRRSLTLSLGLVTPSQAEAGASDKAVALDSRHGNDEVRKGEIHLQPRTP